MVIPVWRNTMKRISGVLLCGVLMLPCAGLWGQAKQRSLPSPADFVGLRRISDPQISPDGKRIAFVVTELAEGERSDNPRKSDIWMVATDGQSPAKRFLAGEKSETLPRWSPNGRWLAFLSDRGETSATEKDRKPSMKQLWLIPADGGEAQQMTRLKGEVTDFQWSPDGRHIALLSADPPTPEEESRQEKKDDRVYVDHEWKYVRLHDFDVATRETKLITRQDFNVNRVEWSPGGNELALVISSTSDLDDVYWHSRLVTVNRQGEILRTLSERSNGVIWGYSPDGEWISFMERSPSNISEHLAVVAAAGGAAQAVDTGYPGTIFWASWAPDSKYLIVESIEGTHELMSGLDVNSGRTRKMFDVQVRYGEEHPFSISRDGSIIACLQESAGSPADIWVIEEDQRKQRQLTHMNPQVDSWQVGTLEEISWKSPRDGKTIYGLVLKPPDYDPSRLYPAIAEIHGGPKWAWWMGWHGSWHEWGQLLAAHGYVVLLPNPRGSDGQGADFAEANRDDWGGGDFVDILSGVDELIARKITDPNRLGIGGWSYGGFMTSWAVTQTNRFKAAVMGAGVSNLFSFNGTTDISPSFMRGYFLDLPFNRREAYDGHSPMSFVKDVKTPTLVLHGGGDRRVPMGQGQEFYRALKQLGVKTEMVVYPREPHGIGEREHQIDLLNRVLNWFDTHLK